MNDMQRLKLKYSRMFYWSFIFIVGLLVALLVTDWHMFAVVLLSSIFLIPLTHATTMLTIIINFEELKSDT